MIKTIFSLTTIMVLSISLCFAQKHSAKTLTLQYEVESTVKGPGKMTKYRPELITTLTEDKADIEAVKKSYLLIPGSFYSMVTDDMLGSEEWVVTLHAGEATITSTSDKPAYLLMPYDEVFRYKTSAKVAVTDKAGTVIWEKVLAPQNELVMTKRDMFIDKNTHRVTTIQQQRPDELKPVLDKMLADKNKLVLYHLAELSREALQFAFNGTRETIQVSIFSVKGKAYGELETIRDNIFDSYLKFRAFNKKNRISKEAMDDVFIKAIPVWEKTATEDKTLEEKATQGLLLNCAVAYCWLGDYDKAKTYLDKLPPYHRGLIKEESDDSPPGSVGATTFLGFEQSEAATREMQFTLKRIHSDMKFSQ